ncbi:hypothetical protein AVEN_207146-1 [Araneus ventricosus]|uniref:Uncharacterized protein n=1 Tax=Araneus ventricosus TaxID=182803 RepID=A0A4Y2PG01_ARAVE|nr:hypothetical protein AVEN_145820-1 [Araneus ventricosus]GBN79068.1 hypothetical protein AVEN_207146-1 [Araneus ventricosus]
MRDKGVIKSISNLSNKQQRIRRKQWKKDSRNHRKQKYLQQAKETPEAEETRVGSRGSPRIRSGRKVAKRTYSSLSEVQAAHFGASKKQLSLHTGVLYFKENTKDLDEHAEADDGTKNLSFCTVSENFLKLNFYQFYVLALKEVHGIFPQQVMVQELWMVLGEPLSEWLDTLVARGTDITDSLLQNLKKTEKTVKLYKIENTDIANLKEKSKDIPQIPNIMQKHQII